MSDALLMEVCGWFENIKPTATCVTARCPVHGDRTNSLCINKGDKPGSVVIKCQAGCDTEAVLGAVGKTFRDLYDQVEHIPQSNIPKQEITYDYTDEDGKLLYQVVRQMPDKKFLQRCPNGSGQWNYRLNGVRRVIYKLPTVIRSVQNGFPIYIVEGEKDADNLNRWGMVATTNSGGAKKWTEDYSEFLKGADVVIFPDNDEPGREHAALVAQSLNNKAKSIKIVRLPNLPSKGDVSDWIKMGGTREALLKIVEDTEVWQPGVTSELPPVSKFPLTDLGNAERLIAKHGTDLRYVNDWKQWLIWNGKYFKPDNTEEIVRRSTDTIRSIVKDEAEVCSDGKLLKKLERHALRSEGAGSIFKMGKLAQSLTEVCATAEQFDKDDWALNVQNGTIDLRTGKVTPHRREDLITRISPVTYDPEAKCPLWQEFLLQIFSGNLDLIDYIQRVVGYALTGETREQCLFFLYGLGANGKSTFVNALESLLGSDYYKAAPAESLMAKRNDNNSAHDIASLRGSRLVSASETEQGKRLSEALIKQLTGGDRISARLLYQNYSSFKPTFKIFLLSNHKPVIHNSDDGIWRRIRLIPFKVRIPDEKQDRELDKKLAGELSGILNWAIEGCMAWQKEGLKPPVEVAKATSDYREEMDLLGEFFEERCILSETMRARVSMVYEEYTKHCQMCGCNPCAMRTFSMKIKERGFEQIRVGGNGDRYWKGIGLRSDIHGMNFNEGNKVINLRGGGQ